jgi:hypothetical protein
MLDDSMELPEPVRASDDTAKAAFQVRALLSLARHDANISRIEDVHLPIESGIKWALDEISRAERKGPEEYADQVNETNLLLIEELLGVALAAAQVYLTVIRTRFVDLAYAYNRAFQTERTVGGKPVLKKQGNKKGFNLFKDTGYTDEPSSPATYTPIQAINAAANYWKHHEEWLCALNSAGTLVWNDQCKNKQQQDTIKIVHQLGMSQSGVWNLQRAVKKLGVENFYDLTPVRRELREWAVSLLKQTEKNIHDHESKQRIHSK